MYISRTLKMNHSKWLSEQWKAGGSGFQEVTLFLTCYTHLPLQSVLQEPSFLLMCICLPQLCGKMTKAGSVCLYHCCAGIRPGEVCFDDLKREQQFEIKHRRYRTTHCFCFWSRYQWWHFWCDFGLSVSRVRQGFRKTCVDNIYLFTQLFYLLW